MCADDTYDQGSLLYLAFVCLAASSGGLLFGINIAVISGAIGLLREQFTLSAAMVGWVVSSALLGSVIGAAVSGVLTDLYGRKKILILAGAVFVLSSLGCALSPSADALVMARVLGGVAVGFAAMASPLYIAEIAPAHLRGRMVTVYQMAINLGICFAYISNAIIGNRASHGAGVGATTLWHSMMRAEPWRGMFFVPVFPAAISILLLLAVPESPRWLIQRGRSGDAKLILTRVLGPSRAQRDLIEIKSNISDESGSFLQLFQHGLRRAVFISVALTFFSEASGITIVLYYGPDIFKSAGLSLGSALGGATTIGIAMLVFTLFASWKVDTLGRRKLLYVGNTGCVAANALLAVLFFTGHTRGLVLVAVICIFIAFFAFSIGPLKFVVMSELFPTRIRGRAMALGILTMFATGGVVNQLFPSLVQRVGQGGSFLIFAAVLLPLFLFVWKVLPETKGRTLEDIQRTWTDQHQAA